MNSRIIHTALLALNLGLAGVFIYLILSFQGPRPSSAGLDPARIVTNTVTHVAVRKVGTTTNLLAALGNRPLSWGALESTNYAVFIENLHAFGCPEETIRDIILTDLARLYSRRRGAIRAQAPPPRFWETGDVSGAPPSLPVEVQRQLRALEQELESLVRSLLGVGFRSELAKYWGEDDAAAQISFLPPEKQQAIRSVQDKYAALEEEIYNRARGLLLDEDSLQLRQLARAREAELAQVLAPAELEEYQLRNSDTAHNLRAQMAGFQPTEQEFRDIFQLQKSFEDRFSQPAADPADPAGQEARARAEAQAQEALEQEMQRVLGPARFAEYQRAQEPDYRGLVQIADRFNLPRDVANNVFDMKTTAERQKALIEANAGLTPEQRGHMIAAIARATERNVAAAMGDDIFRAYQSAAGQWLGELLTVNELNLALPPEPPQPPQPYLPPELRNFLLNPPVLGNPPPLPR